jgi:protocatechuate 3,4-dioxygenase beta subunit
MMNSIVSLPEILVKPASGRSDSAAADRDADIDPGEAGGGVPLYVDVSVTDPAGRPDGGATVDVWHYDAGFYDVQRPELRDDVGAGRFLLRGREDEGPAAA